MSTYIILIIISGIVFIGALGVLIYLLLDERKIKEVDNELLVKLGKKYTKEEFEETMFQQYVDILLGIQNESYNYLRDAVSDEEYNKILLTIKQNSDRGQKEIISNIKKEFSKLISYKINNDLEIAKLWIRYTDNEYILANREVMNEKNEPEMQEVVIQGDKNKIITHEYVLTYVKGRVANEDITCPNCGYHINLLNTSKCVRCESLLAPKKMHWVYLNKTAMNINK